MQFKLDWIKIAIFCFTNRPNPKDVQFTKIKNKENQ